MKNITITLILSCIISFSLPAPCDASEQSRIIVLETMPVPAVTDFSRYFVRELNRLGNELGKTYQITTLEAQGSRETADHLIQESTERFTPDLIVSIATLASQAVRDAVEHTNIPQLFGLVSDPVGAGLIEKIGIPTGQNITGLVAALPRETQLKFAVSLAKQIIPDRPIVIGVVTSDYPASIGDLRMLKEAAALQKDVVIREVIFPYRDMPRYLDDMLADAAEGIRSIEGQVDFWWEVSGPLGEVPEFASMMLKVSNKPVLYGNIMESVKTGALFSMQQDIKKSAAEAARLAQDILGGADRGLIPVLPPRDFTMGINISTALDLHIVVPPEMLKLAGANVFR